MGYSPQPQLPFDADPAAATTSAPRSFIQAVEPASATAPAGGNIELRGQPIDRAPMLLTVRDVEAELQLGRTRTYELIRSGEIPVVRVGRVIRVPREALRRWVEEHLRVGTKG